jgi:HSP20 family molecular chaperone IbpA
MKKQTTDVFVVFDDLSGTITTGYPNSTTSLTSGTYNSGTTLTSTHGTTGYVTDTFLGLSNIGTSATAIWQQPHQLIPQTYNDYWNFDETMDLLWKSFFDKNAHYRPISEKAVQHPVDIQETDNGLKIEIAAVGLDDSDIDIIVDSETLRVAYRKTDDDKQKEKDEYRYLHRSIKKAGFDIAWKVSSKYELPKLSASLDKGLLTLDIPFAKENKPKKIEIKTAKSLIKG